MNFTSKDRQDGSFAGRPPLSLAASLCACVEQVGRRGQGEDWKGPAGATACVPFRACSPGTVLLLLLLIVLLSHSLAFSQS